jgi:hypothetical protein
MSLDDVRKVLQAVDAWLAAEATAAWQASEEAAAAFLSERSDTWAYHYGGFSEAQRHTAFAIEELKDLTNRAGKRRRGQPAVV